MESDAHLRDVDVAVATTGAGITGTSSESHADVVVVGGSASGAAESDSGVVLERNAGDVANVGGVSGSMRPATPGVRLPDDWEADAAAAAASHTGSRVREALPVDPATITGVRIAKIRRLEKQTVCMCSCQTKIILTKTPEDRVKILKHVKKCMYKIRPGATSYEMEIAQREKTLSLLQDMVDKGELGAGEAGVGLSWDNFLPPPAEVIDVSDASEDDAIQSTLVVQKPAARKSVTVKDNAKTALSEPAVVVQKQYGWACSCCAKPIQALRSTIKQHLRACKYGSTDAELDNYTTQALASVGNPGDTEVRRHYQRGNVAHQRPGDAAVEQLKRGSLNEVQGRHGDGKHEEDVDECTNGAAANLDYEVADNDDMLNCKCDDDDDCLPILPAINELSDDDEVMLDVLQRSQQNFTDDAGDIGVHATEVIETLRANFDSCKKKREENNTWKKKFVDVMGCDGVTVIGYRARESYAPFSSYTMFMLVTMMYKLNLSQKDIDFILSMLKHPDFDVADVPTSYRAILKEIKKLPVIPMQKNPSGTEANMNIMEVIQRQDLACPELAKELRFEHVDVRDEENKLYFSHCRSGLNYKALAPSITVNGPHPRSEEFSKWLTLTTGDAVSCVIPGDAEDGETERTMRAVIGVIKEVVWTGVMDEYVEQETPFNYSRRPCYVMVQLYDIDGSVPVKAGTRMKMVKRSPENLKNIMISAWSYEHVNLVPITLLHLDVNGDVDKVIADAAVDSEGDVVYICCCKEDVAWYRKLVARVAVTAAKPMTIALGIFKDGVSTCPFTMNGEEASFFRTLNLPTYYNRTGISNKPWHAVDMLRTNDEQHRRQQSQNEQTLFVEQLCSQVERPMEMFNIATGKIQPHVGVVLTMSLDNPEWMKMTSTKQGHCASCRPLETYVDAHIDVENVTARKSGIFHAPQVEVFPGVLDEGFVWKKFEWEKRVYELTMASARDRPEWYTAELVKKNMIRAEVNPMFEVGTNDISEQTGRRPLDGFTCIQLEAMHNLTQRFGGRAPRFLMGKLLTKLGRAEAKRMYDMFAATARRGGDVDLCCPGLKKYNNCSTLTGRMKANNVVDYLFVMDIIACFVFGDDKAREYDKRLYSQCVTQSNMMKTVADRLKVFGAIRTVVTCTVKVHDILNMAAVRSEAVEELEDLFNKLEEAAEVVNKVMPFHKGKLNVTPNKDEGAGDDDDSDAEGDADGEDDAAAANDAVDVKEVEKYQRIKYTDFASFHPLRKHYMWNIVTKGALRASEQSAGERECGVLRQNVKYTNHLGMSAQLMHRSRIGSMLLSLLLGTPYLLVDGQVLVDKCGLTRAEDRVKYFVESARHGQLLFPGEKLVDLMKTGVLCCPSDDEDEGDASEGLDKGNVANNVIRRQNVEKSLRHLFSATALTSRSTMCITPRSVYRVDNRVQKFTSHDVVENHFTPQQQMAVMQRYRPSIHAAQTRGGVDEELSLKNLRERQKVLEEAFMKTLGVTRREYSQLDEEPYFARYKKLVTSARSIKVGDRVEVKGEEGAVNAEILGMYTTYDGNKVMKTVTAGNEGGIAVVVMYFHVDQAREDNARLRGYESFVSDSVDVISDTSIVSLVHMFRDPGRRNKPPYSLYKNHFAKFHLYH